MIGRILAIVICLAIIIVGVSVYLSPDSLAGCQAPDGQDQCRRAQAIVVVSGGDTNARTDEAIKLFKADWAPLIIVSGAAADKSGPSNAAAMRQRAIDSGVPEDSVVAEEYSETTKQNAANVRQVIERQQIDDIILVTSGYHMRRASLEFKSQLPNQVVIRTHPATDDRQWGVAWWLTPWGWWLAVSEVAKIILFSIGGSR